MNTTRHFYLNQERTGRILACIARTFDKETGEIQFAVATPHPNDVPSKALARTIACGRLAKHPHTLYAQGATPPMATILEAIVNAKTDEDRGNLHVSRDVQARAKRYLAEAQAKLTE